MRRRRSFFTFPFSNRRTDSRPAQPDARQRAVSIGDVLATLQRIEPDASESAVGQEGSGGTNVTIFTPPVTAHALPADAARKEPMHMYGKHAQPEVERRGEGRAEARAETRAETRACGRKERDEAHLISDAAEAATVATLTELARRSRGDRSLSLPGGERTLEHVVREAVSEHLSGWLDANLPALVERVVRDEVRRLAKRAEDD